MLKRSSYLLDHVRAGCLPLFFCVALSPAAAQTFVLADGANWETCTGTFYDSGGSAGNYANNEDLTATLCPTGGAFSGPFTSIVFNTFTVNTGDTLYVHDGVSDTDPLVATGTQASPLTGQTITAASASGCLTFVWRSNGSTVAAGWNATITTGPPAFTGGSISICSDDAAFDLFSSLTGAPGGGVWTFGGNPVSNTYSPGVSQEGTYTYTITAPPPCADASATVVVNEEQAPNAGISNSISVCSNDAAFSMRAELLGTPDLGGVWRDDQNVVHPNQFDPAAESVGVHVYTYTVTGTPPCTDATAQLTITVVEAPDAGTNASYTTCGNSAQFDMFGLLGGTPDVGGTWLAPGNVAHGSQFQPSIDPGGVYKYIVPGTGPCEADTARLTITVAPPPNAGTSTNVSKCSNNASFTLLSQLGGTPQNTGTWVGPDAVSHPANYQFVPGTTQAGLYTYTVTGDPACAPAVSTVNVSVVTAPNAGTDAALTVCSTDGSFALFNLLTGNPDGGGSWRDPLNNPFPSGQFVPGTSLAGVYKYIVAGTAPCAADTARVTITQVTAADAGSNGSVTLCSNDPPETLFVHLGGTPDNNGTWTRPGGQTFGGVYNPANVNHPAGTYVYTVVGAAPCPSVQASVQVVENQAPNAGNDNTVTFCSNNPVVNLINSLAGNPNGTGSWIGPTDQPFDGTFDPASDPAGVYKYIVTGLPPCANDTGRVTVIVNQAPDAGLNGSVSVCSNATQVDLFTQLLGSPDGGGTWKDPLNAAHDGTYEPGTGALEGAYQYKVLGIAPCLNATAIVTVNEERLPVAGSNGSVTLCSTEPPLNLISRLGGTPDAGGTWTPGAANGVFTPGTSTPGVYTYTVDGVAPCPDATATVTVTVNQAPNAGGDGNIPVCQGQPSVNLFTGLGAPYDNGGDWADTDNTNQLSGNIFSPSGLPPGSYDFTYSVDAIGQCAGDEAVVTVTIVSQLDAGNGGDVNVCSSVTDYDLYDGISGSPDLGGQWQDLDNSGGLFGGHFFNANLAGPGTYHFEYELTGSLGCASDQTIVEVHVFAAPRAGTDGVLEICSNGTPVSLFNYITGEQGGGNWKFNFSNHSSNYSPASDISGNYYYIVQGMGPCVADTSLVVVTETQAPDPGISDAIEVCETDAAFDMTAQLGGTPSPNGTWYDPFLVQHNATFIPGFDPQGSWTYRVSGTGPCAPQNAQLNITVNEPPFAGLGSDTTVCTNGGPFLLYTRLSAGFDVTGTWYDPSLDVVPFGQHDPPGEPGQYIYVVVGDGSCPNDTAFVTIFENEAANAGLSDDTTLCSTGGSVSLLTVLDGSPDPGGTWVGPGGPNNGSFLPGISQPGNYIYTVSGLPPCSSAVASVSVVVNTPPNAGCGASIFVCNTDVAFNMRTRLGCNPSTTGYWTFLGQPHDGIFIPGTSLAGTYVYHVDVNGPCPDATASLTITVSTAVSAGTASPVNLCSSNGSFNLADALTGESPGGTWTNPLNVPHSGIFIPGIDPVGNYRYTVVGAFPCPSDFELVNVQVQQEADAGDDEVIQVCSTDGAILLINELGGDPDLNGSWTDPGDDPFNGLYQPGSSDPGLYTYVVLGVGPCPNDTAYINVFQNQAVEGGTSTFVDRCSSDLSTFFLIDSLDGSPTPGGTWTDPDGDASSGLFDPSTDDPGVYTYHVEGQGACDNDSATVTVTIVPQPNAGCSASALICNTSPAVDLTALLGCSPALNGTWTGPNGQPHIPFFNPATDPAGIYTYAVAGIAPCDTAFSTVQITLTNAPNAGGDGAITSCTNNAQIALLGGLLGSPQPTGTWSNLDNVGTLIGHILNATSVPQGTYDFRYVVTGNGTCASDTAMLTLTITNALDAGANGTANVCLSQDPVELITLLNGSPQAGGEWIDLDGSGAIEDGYFDPLDAGVGVFDVRYRLESSGCAADSALVTITVLQGPRAGENGNGTYCGLSQTIALSSLLSGPHDNNGTWFDQDGDPVVPPTFDPSVDADTLYIYVVPAIGQCPNDTAFFDIHIDEAPDAGTSGTLTVCEDGDPVDLFLYLNGTPDPGGTWTYSNLLHPNIYNPGADNPGIYSYTVNGVGACPPRQSDVFVTEQEAPDAGLSNTIPVCSSQTPFAMIDLLAGGPQSGGTWTDPNGDPHGPDFDPASDIGGAYIYTVSGGANCDSATATLNVNLTIAPDAGDDSTLNVCISVDSVDLFLALGPDADANGNWTDVNGSGAFDNGMFYPSQAAPGTYDFAYSVAGAGTCTGDVDTVTVVLGAGLDPGIGGTDTICGGLVAYNVFNSLGGTPDHTGIWYESLGDVLTDSLLNATLLEPGSPYPITYTVTDPGCGELSVVVEIVTTPWSDPGGDSTLYVCENSSTVDLFAALSGSPDAGGTWSGPGGATDGQFTPGVDQPGDYVYLVQGTAPCDDTTATVTVVLNTPANAGSDVTQGICNTGTVDLITVLGAGAQTTGTFTDNDNTGALTGSILDLEQLSLGSVHITYTVEVPGCATDVAAIVVDVVEGVRIKDTLLVCDEVHRTYQVQLTVIGGDVNTYYATGLGGTFITADGNTIFYSDTLFTSQSFAVTIDDSSHCSPRVVEGSSPCVFEDEVFVPESFTPNGDGINDRFIIPGIEGYPGNTIAIFNRWGSEVFSGAGYDNRTVVWDGTSPNAVIEGDLPTGTYYYVLELGNGTQPYKGFVYLNR